MSFRRMVDLLNPDLAHSRSPHLLADHRTTPPQNTPCRANLAQLRKSGLIAGSFRLRFIDDTAPDNEFRSSTIGRKNASQENPEMAEKPGQRFRFRAVDKTIWEDLVKLFEGRGGPSYCWCMVWRPKPVGASKWPKNERKRMLQTQLRNLVSNGVPVGIVAYHERTPVGWCSVAPRSTFKKIGGPEYGEEDENRVWSITCFFVKRAYRGRGLFSGLLEAAVSTARDQDARVIEAYPVDRDSPSYRFMGFVESFRNAGFVEVGRAGSRRYVMRLRV